MSKKKKNETLARAIRRPIPERRMNRPNVLLILTDDQGWGDLSCKGNQNIHTPRIDQLAAEGADFDWFYVTPLCAPSAPLSAQVSSCA